MESHKPAIVANFDTFVEEMVTAVPPETSLHVGITRATGMFDPGNGSSISGCDMFSVDGTWNPPEVSATTTNGQQGRLYEQSGQRFFELETGTDTAALKTWFHDGLAGAIAGDQHSNTETVIASAAYPFNPINATHNAGFLRVNAVLVIFLLSDAPDLSPDSVQTADLIQMVRSAKAGCGDQCVLTTGLVSAGCYDPSSATPAFTNTRIYDFMNGFGRPPASYVELSAGGPTPDLSGVLGQTLAEVIGTTCEQIPPVG
jgi:hypothetical protein